MDDRKLPDPAYFHTAVEFEDEIKRIITASVTPELISAYHEGQRKALAEIFADLPHAYWKLGRETTRRRALRVQRRSKATARLVRVSWPVGDLEKAARLYRELLDLEGVQLPGQYDLPCGGICLSLVAAPVVTRKVTSHAHLEFYVGDLNALTERAHRLRLRVEGSTTAAGESAVMIRDPWGNVIRALQVG